MAQGLGQMESDRAAPRQVARGGSDTLMRLTCGSFPIITGPQGTITRVISPQGFKINFQIQEPRVRETQ